MVVVVVVVVAAAAVGVPRLLLLQLPRCPACLIPRPMWTVIRVVLLAAWLVLIVFLRPTQHPTCSVVICFARSSGATKR